MKAADSSKRMATIGENNWCPNSGARNLNLYHHEKAKIQKLEQLIKMFILHYAYQAPIIR
jgi:hypothetical protein